MTFNWRKKTVTKQTTEALFEPPFRSSFAGSTSVLQQRLWQSKQRPVLRFSFGVPKVGWSREKKNNKGHQKGWPFNLFWDVFFLGWKGSWSVIILWWGVNSTSPEKMVLFDGFVLQGSFFNHKLYLGNQPVQKNCLLLTPVYFKWTRVS